MTNVVGIGKAYKPHIVWLGSDLWPEWNASWRGYALRIKKLAADNYELSVDGAAVGTRATLAAAKQFAEIVLDD